MSNSPFVSTSGSLRRSLAIQSRIVRALLLREILTRFGRHNIGFLWLFVEPMLFTLGGCGVWSLIDAARVILGRVNDADGRPLSD